MKEGLIRHHREQLRIFRAGLKAWRRLDTHGTCNTVKERHVMEHGKLVEFHRGAVGWLKAK